jgi:exoribonuclease R
MGTRVLRARDAAVDALRDGIAAIQQELHVDPEFPAEVLAAATEDAREPRMPALDLTDLEFVTIDPAGSMDLDQAMHLAQDGDGFVVHYAIADVMAFVEPGDPVDVESHARGESLYGADSKVPLHPTALSEGAASLLPDVERPAFVWTIDLSADGTITGAKVERARVRSRARLDYEGVQHEPAPPGSTLALLETVGKLRIEQEAKRGGVSLPMPAQEVDIADDQCRLEYREMLPVESWNAQLSLMTGFAAASLMIEGKLGILRTLPPAPEDAVARLRRTARALGIDWPRSMAHPEFIRGLDPSRPAHAAMVVACTRLLRGAGYAAFHGHLPDQLEHAALASPYAHVTAPLRRLVDRYGLEICAAHCAGTEVPGWVLDGMDALPDVMRDSGRKSHAYENAVVNLVEALTLEQRVGETFGGVVLEVEHDDEREGTVMVREPAVEAPVSSTGPLPVGEEVSVTLAEADPATRRVRFRR